MWIGKWESDISSLRARIMFRFYTNEGWENGFLKKMEDHSNEQFMAKAVIVIVNHTKKVFLIKISFHERQIEQTLMFDEFIWKMTMKCSTRNYLRKKKFKENRRCPTKARRSVTKNFFKKKVYNNCSILISRLFCLFNFTKE